MVELKKLDYIDTDLLKYKNIIDVISLFNTDNISKSLFNIFTHILNKQIEIDKDVKNLPLFVAHENTLNIKFLNLEYNAFIYGISQLLSEDTRDNFIQNHKLSGENLKNNSLIYQNFSLINALEKCLDLVYLNSNNKLMSAYYYKPIVYSFDDKEPIQMAAIAIKYNTLIGYLSKINNSQKLISSINFLYSETSQNVKLLAFANKECADFWKKNKEKKRILFDLSGMDF